MPLLFQLSLALLATIMVSSTVANDTPSSSTFQPTHRLSQMLVQVLPRGREVQLHELCHTENQGAAMFAAAGKPNHCVRRMRELEQTQPYLVCSVDNYNSAVACAMYATAQQMLQYPTNWLLRMERLRDELDVLLYEQGYDNTKMVMGADSCMAQDLEGTRGRCVMGPMGDSIMAHVMHRYHCLRYRAMYGGLRSWEWLSERWQQRPRLLGSG